ncbi:MAG: VCBS domain-containing protein [Sulfitobacter sp.]
MFFTQTTDTTSGTPQLQFAIEPDGTWALPEDLSIFTSEYGRSGQDLILQTADGQEARLVGYFDTEVPADLVAFDGAILRGSVVDRLAGPLFPAQYAQSGGVNLADAIGQVETLTGAAFVQRTDGSTVELEIGTKVFQGDVVRTENGSTLGLTFADGTIFTLASGSRMVLDELIYDPQANDNSAVFNLVEGSFVFIAGQTAKTGGIEIQSPAATMGIRGTTGKIDIQTTNGVTTVTVSLNPDPDGGLGAIELFDLAGNLITTITGTETKWIISPPFTNEPPVEVERDAAGLADDAFLLSQALAAFQSAVGRVQQGQNFVEFQDRDRDDNEDGDQGNRQEEGEESDDAPDQTTPIAPPPLDEEGGDSGEGSESGSGNPELDGTDEQIIEPESGGNEDDDASLTPPTSDPGVQVTDNDNRPELSDLAVQSTEDTSVTTSVPISGGNGEQIAVSLSRGAENGLVVLASDGTFTYTPDPNFDGTDTFEISGIDADGAIQTAEITIVVDPVNDAPIVSFRTVQAVSLEEGASTLAGSGAVSGTLTYVDVDEDIATGTWTIAADSGNATSFGAISIDADTGIWTYALDQAATDGLTDGDTFDEIFTATITDQDGASDTTTLIITVAGTNDSPEIIAAVEQTSASLVTGPRAEEFEGTGVVTTGTVSGVLEYTDVDEGSEAAIWSIAADAGNETDIGSISIDPATGRWTYVLSQDPADAPGNGETITEVFTATITDAGGASASQDISISITGTNDAPEIVFSIEDVFARVVEGGFDNSAIVASSRVPVGADGLRQSRVDPDSVQTFERSQANTTEGPNATGTLRYTDQDGAPGEAVWSIAVQEASFGTMTIDPATGQWQYFLDEEAANSLREGDEVIETFLATVTDPFGGTASQVITITVEGSNDEAEIISAPQDLVGTVAEDGVSVASGQLSFVDPDAAPGETARWSISADGPSRGQIVIDADTGEWTYTLDQNAAQGLKGGETATETFTATVTDSLGATADQTITISLEGQNDGPVLVSGTAVLVAQEPTVTISLTGLGFDPDGETLVFAISGQPDGGAASINGSELTFFTQGEFDDLLEGQSRDVTVSITASDPAGVTTASDVVITITGTNTGPIITSPISAAQGSLVEDVPPVLGGPVSISGTLTYIDNDATTATSGIWSVAPAGSALGNISINAETGVWTYTLTVPGKDALNAGQQATDTFVATITDEDGQTDAQEITISVTGTNDAPVLSSGTASVLKSAPLLNVDLASLGSDLDAENDGASLSYTLNGGPLAQGSASIEGTTLIFSPDGDFNDLSDGQSSTVVLSVTATDDRGATDTNDVTITVTGTSNAPVITSDSSAGNGSVTEAGTITGTAVATGQLTYTDVDAASPTSGVWSISPDLTTLGMISIDATTGEWTYTLNNAAADSLGQGEFVEEVFTATITDADGLTDTQSIQIIVNGSNDAPTLAATMRSVESDAGSVVVDLADFAGDPDAQDTVADLTFSVTDAPGLGTTSLVGSTLTFQLGTDFDDLELGEERQVVIDLDVEDPQNASDSATLTITVTGTDGSPVITSTLEDATGTAREEGIGVPPSGGVAVATGTLTFSDDGPVGTWFITSLAADNIGTASIDALSGEWSYFLAPLAGNDLAEGQTTVDLFRATVTDSEGQTATQDVTITITGTNDAPIVSAGTLAATEDGAAVDLDLTALGSDVDTGEDGSTLTYSIQSPVAGASIISSAGGPRLQFDPGSDFQSLAMGATQDVAVTIVAEDSEGAQGSGEVTVTVTGVNDAPTLLSAGVGIGEESPMVPLDLSPFADDVDDGEDGTTLSYQILSGPSKGSAEIDGTIITYDPNGEFEALGAGEFESISIEVQAQDSVGAVSEVRTVTFTVTGANDNPLAPNTSVDYDFDTIPIEIDALALVSDIDSDSVSLNGVSVAGQGLVSIDDKGTSDVSDDTILYTANAGALGTDSFTYNVLDSDGGTASGTITVNLLNTAPNVTNSSANVSTASAGTPPPGPGWVQWSEADGGNDHFYQYVNAQTNWADAREDAALRGGHLATITSAGEQAFIDNLPSPTGVGWLGASDAGVEDQWIWVDGPEAGQQFWQGTSFGSPIGGAFENWATGEPLAGNALTEDALHTFGDGTWNDISEFISLAGYFLEFSGPPVVTGSIAGDVTDIESDTITFAATNSVAGVTLDSAGNWAFDPTNAAYTFLAAGQVETFNLTYTATDEHGAAATGSLAFNVTGINDAPIFENLDFGSIDENASPQVLDLLSGATDPDLIDSLQVTNFAFQWTGAGPSPELELAGSEVEFDPADFSALDTGDVATLELTYDVFDGTVAIARTATIDVTGVTDGGPPGNIVANDDNLSPGGTAVTNEDIPATISTLTLLANDDDPGGLGVNFIQVDAYSAQGATLTLSGTDLFYNPTTSSLLNGLDLGEETTDTFTYLIASDDGSQVESATVSLVVAGLDSLGDNAPVSFDLDGEGFEQGSANIYQVNPIFFRDDDAFTGITYKFGQTFVDGELPNFLTFDPSSRNLSVNGRFTGLDVGTHNLFLSGFEADGDFTVVPFQIQLGADGDFDYTLFGVGNSIGATPLLEVGIDSDFGLGDLPLGVLVDLSGLGAPLADVEIIDIRNAQENRLTIDVDDVLALVSGNAADANERIDVDIDTDDLFDIETGAGDWILTSVGSNGTQLTAVDGGAFDGMGVLATFFVDDGVPS